MILALVTVSFAVSSDHGVGTGATSVYLTSKVESWMDPIYSNKGSSLISFSCPFRKLDTPPITSQTDPIFWVFVL